MPTYGSERAVVLPQLQNASEPGWRFLEQYQQNQRMAEDKRRYEQERNDHMLQWALEKMDYSKVATGTAYDPIINQSNQDLLKSTTDGIINGKFANNAEMMTHVMSGVADITAYSNAVKLQRAKIEEELKQYEKDPSIDLNKLRKASFDKAFWNFDAEGHQVSMRKPTEFENKSYVDDVLTNSPESVVTGPQALYESLPKQNFQEVKDKYKRRDSKGHLIDDSYAGKVYDFQEVWFDDKDNDKAKLRTRQNPVKLSNGTQLNGLADDVYERMFGSGANKRILDAEYNKLYKGKDGNLDAEDKSKIKQSLALDMINSTKVGKIENSDADLQKMPSNRTYNTINMPGGAPVRDVYGIINGMATERQGRHLQVNLLPTDIQQKLVGIANDIGPQRLGKDDKPVPYTNASIYVRKESNGLVMREATTNKLIAILDEAGLNVGMQPTAKGKNAVIGETNKDNSGGYSDVQYNDNQVAEFYKKYGANALSKLRAAGYNGDQLNRAKKAISQLQSGKSNNSTNNKSGSWKDRAKSVK